MYKTAIVITGAAVLGVIWSTATLIMVCEAVQLLLTISDENKAKKQKEHMESKLSKIFYSPQGYWKGLAAVKKLSTVAKVSEEAAKNGSLNKPFCKCISQHHATSLGQSLMSHCPMQCIKQTFFLPHDKLPHGRKVYKYALTVVDVASRYKAAEPLTSKESDEVSKAFQRIYKRGPLKWPQLLQVDPGREFMGAVTGKGYAE